VFEVFINGITKSELPAVICETAVFVVTMNTFLRRFLLFLLFLKLFNNLGDSLETFGTVSGCTVQSLQRLTLKRFSHFNLGTRYILLHDLVVENHHLHKMPHAYTTDDKQKSHMGTQVRNI